MTKRGARSHLPASWRERTRSQTEKGGSRKSKFMAELGIKAVCFEALYPEESLHTADVNWFKQNIEVLKKHIQDWEELY